MNHRIFIKGKDTKACANARAPTACKFPQLGPRATFANVCLWPCMRQRSGLSRTLYGPNVGRPVCEGSWGRCDTRGNTRTGAPAIVLHQDRCFFWGYDVFWTTSNCVCGLKNAFEITVECALVVPCSSLSCAIIFIFSFCVLLSLSLTSAEPALTGGEDRSRPWEEGRSPNTV